MRDRLLVMSQLLGSGSSYTSAPIGNHASLDAGFRPFLVQRLCAAEERVGDKKVPRHTRRVALCSRCLGISPELVGLLHQQPRIRVSRLEPPRVEVDLAAEALP